MVGGVVENVNRACRVIIFDVLNTSAWSDVKIYYPSNHILQKFERNQIGSSAGTNLVPLELVQNGGWRGSRFALLTMQICLEHQI